MVNILIHEYYYRYRQFRKNIKNTVDSANYVQARTELTNLITEHESKFPDSDSTKDFNWGEKIMMTHAKRHVDAILTQDVSGYLDIHIDTVKDALVRVPKSDYQD